MKTILSGLMATALATSFAIAVPEPTNAAPYVPKAEQAWTDVQNADHTYRPWRWQQERRAERRDYRNWRRYAWRERCYRWGDCPPHAYGRRYGFGPNYYYRRHYHRRPGVTLEFNF
jgi:hypothetical protein